MSNDLQYEMLLQTIKEFVDHTREELKQRWKRWPVDLAKGELHEAVGALLAR
jgi:hypothetical protein